MDKKNQKYNPVGMIMLLTIIFVYLIYTAVRQSQHFELGVEQAQAQIRTKAGSELSAAVDIITQNIEKSSCVRNSPQPQEDLAFHKRMLPHSNDFNSYYQNSGYLVWNQCFENSVSLLSLATDPENIKALQELTLHQSPPRN